MNKIYKIVWNKALGQMVVVSEHAKSAAKGTTVGTHLSRPLHKTQNVSACPQWLLCSLSLSMALVANATWAGVANTALPTGANITQGSAQISQNNNSLNINQNSQNLSTNWNSFNIGKDATVNFNQPNQSAIAVNRVLDNNASQIMGKLNANGQVFLLNPNGVIFSKTAQVNVGGIVASTLNLSDSDIAQGKFTLKNSLENQGNAGSVENYGSIIAGGGVVALIAPTVKNHGTIQANNGVVHLTAADQVTLQLQDGSLVEYQIGLGTLQGLVENGGAIQADNGAVYLTAQAKNSLSQAVVNHTGIIEANRLSKNAKGEIILLGDMQTGTTTVSGTLKAEGKNGQDGGFIETSAANVQIAGSTKVSTLSDSGKTGEWLIDPFNVTISNQAQAGNNNAGNTFTPSQNDSIINVGTLNSALASNNITVTTAGAGTQAGNINVNADVTWNANTALTLRADNDININANITATGNTGKLNLQYGQTTSNSNASYYLNNGAKVNLKAGQNFSTQKGANAPINYTVITDLGAAGSTTGTDLQGINGGLTGNYVLGADINAATTSGWNAGQGFSPIGTYGNEFKGKFDGLNHTISNLYINRPSQSNIGLFGATDAASIQNVGIMGGSITGNSVVGGLVGGNYNNATIHSSYATAQVIAKSFAGGLTGANSSSSRIENSYATGDVTAQGIYSQAGGLSGNNFGNSTILNSYATGKVTGVDIAGGLLGNNDSSTVENSYATGQVSISIGTEQGGLVGRTGGTIKNSYYDKTSTGQANAVGDGTGTVTATDITVANRYSRNGYSNLGTWSLLAGTTNVYVAKQGGVEKWVMIEGQTRPFLWSEYSTNVSNAHQLQLMAVDLTKNYTLNNNIDATATKGTNASDMWSTQGFNPIGNAITPFTGKFDGLSHTVNNLYINRPLQSYIGLFGYARNASIKNIGLLNANIQGKERVGTLIGHADNSTNTENAFSTGQVKGDWSVGGLVGWNMNQSSIRSSYSNAQVTTTSGFAGGLVGANEMNARIENSYATGVVSGIIYVGGLSGGNDAVIENSYATGMVTGSSAYFGGLVGGGNGGTVTNGYWNKETTGQASSAGGTGLTTAQMKNGANFAFIDADSYLGGKNTVWRMYEGDTAPLLRSFLTQANVGAIADQSKTYNGQIQTLDLSSVNTTGLDSNKLFTGQSSSKNVGTYNIGLHSNQQGYDLIGGRGTLEITPKDVYVTGFTTQDRAYDGSTAITVTGTANLNWSQTVGSDDIVFTYTGAGTGTGAVADKNVGNNKDVTVTLNGTMGLIGADAGNYNLVMPTLKANITPAILTYTANAASRKYGEINPLFTGSVTGFVTGEDLATATTGTAGFNSTATTTSNVGNYAIDGSGLTANHGNYVFAQNAANTTALTINPATLTITADAGQHKVYGDTDPTLGYGVSGWKLSDDNSLLTGTLGRDSGENVGLYTMNKGTVAAGGNYTIAYDAASPQFEITPATLTIIADAGQHKVYGDADPTLGYAVSGWKFSDDNSLLTGALGRTVGKNVGNYAINQGNLLATNNYDISYTGADFAITPRTLTATINAQNKTYDGNSSAAVIYGDNRVSGDFLNITGNPATFSDKNAAIGKTVTANGLTLSGADAGNYVLAATTATDTADISKAQATVIADSKTTVYNGQDQTVNGFSVTGLVNGEDQSVLTHVRATVTAKEVGTYANKATGMDGNYELRFVDGVLEIQASPIEPKPPVPQPEPEQPKPPVPQPEPEQPKPPVPQPEPEQPKPPVPQPEPEQPPVTPSYYPTWANPYQRAIRTQPVQQKPKAFDIVEIEIEGNGINMDNIQTLGSN
ncbi:MBG domain-containing protein [Acinetobacter sp. YH12039]|uniref:MBG domain-containing protein n=1 Tax=Acinetobacter sp. YH12039 TaxID=2601047 RepID=UPI0015D2669E|nr:MBG domain-containing protein [Acinetobacter sp. YH12039]